MYFLQKQEFDIVEYAEKGINYMYIFTCFLVHDIIR